EELLGWPTWRNSHLDTCLRAYYRSSRPSGPVEPDVRRRQLRLPLGLRGCNGSRLPLSHTPKRQDENTGALARRGLGRLESDHLERVYLIPYRVENRGGIPFIVPDEATSSPEQVPFWRLAFFERILSLACANVGFLAGRKRDDLRKSVDVASRRVVG